MILDTCRHVPTAGALAERLHRERGVTRPRHETSPEAGFTLIEMMVVVLIVAVLASVAVVAYLRHLKSGYVTQAQIFMTQIQARQEAYFQQWGSYLDVSSDGKFFPALSAPEPKAKPWTSVPARWKALGARPEGGSSYFAFYVRASNPTTNHALDSIAKASWVGIPDQPTSTTDAGVPATPHPWYYAIATGDLEGGETYTNGGCALDLGSKCTMLVSTSARSEVRVYNRGQ